MIKGKITEAMVRQTVRDCFKEGYGNMYVTIYLNDLARSKDLTREQVKGIWADVASGKI